jgi:glycosyltransferase involved in cell wall biosynthesis
MSTPYILLLTRALDTGGAQRQLIELAIGLKRAGWRVAVATFYPGGTLENRVGAAGIRIFSLDKRGRWDVLPFLWRFVKLMRAERPHFAKGYLVMSNLLLAALRPALGHTRVVWGVAASEMDLNDYDWLAKVEFRLSVLCSRWAHLIIANSEAGGRYHVTQGYPSERMVVIPNGIDVEQFSPDATAREHIRREWGLAPNEVLIALVGRVDPVKDHANFLHAAAAVAAARPQTRFVCVGPHSGAYSHKMAVLADTLGLRPRLIWAGDRSDMSRVYNAFDLLVSSSRSEGLPNVVAEAMATGVPCVVTDVGDSARLVGPHGWVCPPGDSRALAASIVQALDALPGEPVLGRQRICDEFSTDALVRHTAEHLYRLYPPSGVPRRILPE